MSPTAQPFDRRNFPLKKKLKKTMGLSLIPRYILTISNDVCKNNFLRKARSLSPSRKPPMFSGDGMSYPSFIAAFEVLIASKVDNLSECLYFVDRLGSIH